MTPSHAVKASNRYRYGAAHAARSLCWSTVDLFLAWHIHEKVGLGGLQTGVVLFVLLAVGGTATFLIGLAFSRYPLSGIRMVRLQVYATMGVALSLVGQFAIAGPLATILVGLCFRLCYAVQDVTQNVLGMMLPADDCEVHLYARQRVILSAVTRCLVVTGIAFTSPALITPMLSLIGVAMITSAASLRGLSFPRLRLEGATKGQAALPRALPSLLFSWVIAGALLPTLSRILIFTPSTTGLPQPGFWLLSAFCLGSIVGPLLPSSRHPSLSILLIVASGAVMILPVPFVGDGILRMGAAMFHGIGVSSIGVRLWARTSRLAIAEADRGHSNAGLIVSSVILTIQLASAVGMLILGPLIERFETGWSAAGLLALGLTGTGALLIAGLDFSCSERIPPATA